MGYTMKPCMNQVEIVKSITFIFSYPHYPNLVLRRRPPTSRQLASAGVGESYCVSHHQRIGIHGHWSNQSFTGKACTALHPEPASSIHLCRGCIRRTSLGTFAFQKYWNCVFRLKFGTCTKAIFGDHTAGCAYRECANQSIDDELYCVGLFGPTWRSLSPQLHTVTQTPNTRNRRSFQKSLHWSRCFSVPPLAMFDPP